MSADSRTDGRDELLDHEADGIREFDNDLPRWWLYGFYFTIVFAAVYIANYHLLPTPVFGSKGMAAEYHAEMELAKAAAASRPQPAAAAPQVALTDEQSLTRGKAIFEGQDNVCAACHRPDLGGMVGPNLTDDYWLHGCSVQQVASSIRTGYPTKGMLAFGTGKTLTDAQVLEVASYVLSRRGTNPAGAKTIEPERDLVCR
jgi:cytochrome c oxidase cbb3-type subunit III